MNTLIINIFNAVIIPSKAFQAEEHGANLFAFAIYWPSLPTFECSFMWISFTASVTLVTGASCLSAEQSWRAFWSRCLDRWKRSGVSSNLWQRRLKRWRGSTAPSLPHQTQMRVRLLYFSNLLFSKLFQMVFPGGGKLQKVWIFPQKHCVFILTGLG